MMHDKNEAFSAEYLFKMAQTLIERSKDGANTKIVGAPKNIGNGSFGTYFGVEVELPHERKNFKTQKILGMKCVEGFSKLEVWSS